MAAARVMIAFATGALAFILTGCSGPSTECTVLLENANSRLSAADERSAADKACKCAIYKDASLVAQYQSIVDNCVDRKQAAQEAIDQITQLRADFGCPASQVAGSQMV